MQVLNPCVCMSVWFSILVLQYIHCIIISEAIVRLLGGGGGDQGGHQVGSVLDAR